MNSWEKLGMEVTRSVDEAIGERDHVAIVRDRIINTRMDDRSGSRRPVVFLVATSALIAFGLWFLWFSLEQDGNPITYRIRGGYQQGSIESWISSRAQETLPISFSDGSTIELDPSSDARIDDLTSEGARIILERGGATVDIKHSEDTRWHLDVGPYRVMVTGTRFDVSWDPEGNIFKIAMDEGSVNVSGPLVEDGSTISKGEMLRAYPHQGRLEKFKASEPIAASSGETGAGPSEVAAEANPAREELSGPNDAGEQERLPSSAKNPSRKSWKDAYKGWKAAADAGRYDEALRIVEANGVSAFLSRADAQDLFSLGSGARILKRWDLAERFLQEIERKHANTRYGDRASFMLGKIAFDVRRNYGEAARRFAKYESRSKSDPLRREALGRLIEARMNLGDRLGSESAAKAYLASYPKGPHASLANRVIGAPLGEVP